MDELRHQETADNNLAPWEVALAQRLASLRDMAAPPSLDAGAEERFLQRIRVPSAKAPIAVRRPTPVLRFGLRFAAVVIACVFALCGVGYATATSLPGAPLYALKRQVETVEIAVSPVDQQPALAATLVDRRLAEVVQLVGQHAPDSRLDAGVAEYQAATAALGRTPAAPLKETVFRRHLAVLARLESTVPEDTRVALRRAQQAAEQQLDNDSPAAPQPTTELPTARPSFAPASATPHVRPSATTAPATATVSSAPQEAPAEPVVPPNVVSTRAPEDVRPSATAEAPPVAPEQPRPTPLVAPTEAAAKTAPARRSSPPARQPSEAPPAPPERPADGSGQPPAPEHPAEPQPAPPERPADGSGQPPAPTSEHTERPRDNDPAPPAPPSAAQPERTSEAPASTDVPAEKPAPPAPDAPREPSSQPDQDKEHPSQPAPDTPREPPSHPSGPPAPPQQPAGP